eukprot:6312978-Amphidinium_carterae.1
MVARRNQQTKSTSSKTQETASAYSPTENYYVTVCVGTVFRERGSVCGVALPPLASSIEVASLSGARWMDLRHNQARRITQQIRNTYEQALLISN